MNDILFTIRKCQKGSEFEYSISTNSRNARRDHKDCSFHCSKNTLFDTMDDLTWFYNNRSEDPCGVVFEVE